VGVGFGVFWFFVGFGLVCLSGFMVFVFFPLGFWLVIPVYMSCIRRGALRFSIKLLLLI
jgi:hypothetical protein